MAREARKMSDRIRLLTKERKEFLVRQENEIQEILEEDPEYALKKRYADRNGAAAQIVDLRRRLQHCKPFIERIKFRVPKISDETTEAACYLLFCQAVQHFEAVFALAAQGLSLQASDLIRAIGESLDLIVLFLVEDPNHTSLRKWFGGEIVPNRIARETADRFLNEGRSESQPVRELKAGIYTALSSYSQMSYTAVLNSIDVFARDFDWHRSAGYHYANADSLPYAKDILRAMVLTLKQFYGLHIGDRTTFLELDKIYRHLD